jgi:undecaprenyl-diphosphatase
MFIAHEAATLVKDFVKRRVDRTRPRSRTNTESHKPKPGGDTSKEETSFPSGHSTGAAAVARAFAREFPEHKAVAYTGAGLIALAQIPRCAHYLTDVGSGLAVGTAAEAAVAWLFDPIADRIERAVTAGTSTSTAPAE